MEALRFYGSPAFVTPLRAEYQGGDDWLILEALVYDSALIGRVVVPRGLVTDLASVPRWLPIAYATAGGRAHPAAVVHDYLYGTHPCARAAADAVFLEAMTVTGEPAWRRLAMYRAVRWFGGWSYASGPARRRLLNAEPLPPPLPGDLT